MNSAATGGLILVGLRPPCMRSPVAVATTTWLAIHLKSAGPCLDEPGQLYLSDSGSIKEERRANCPPNRHATKTLGQSCQRCPSWLPLALFEAI